MRPATMAAAVLFMAGVGPGLALQNTKVPSWAAPGLKVATVDEVRAKLKQADVSSSGSTRLSALVWLSRVLPPNKEIQAEVVRKLIEYTQDTNAIIRGRAGDALPNWSTTEVGDQLILLMEGNGPSERVGAITALGRVKYTKAIPNLITSVHSPRGNLQDLSAKSLVEMGPAAEKAVHELLEKKNTSPVRLGCWILLQMGSKESLPALEKLLAHRDRAVAHSAAAAIDAIKHRIEGGSSTVTRKTPFKPPAGAKIATPEEVAAKMELATVWHPAATRVSALQWLAKVFPPNDEIRTLVARKLIEYSDDTNAIVRGRAGDALPNWATAEIGWPMIILMEGNGPSERKGAITALGRVGFAKAIPHLIRSVQSGRDRELAGQALVDMGPSAEAAVLKVLEDKDTGAVRKACWVLMQIGGKESLPALEKVAQNRDRSVAASAASALRAIKDRTNK